MAWEHAWWLRTIAAFDLDAMGRAAACLVGEHDFKSFCKAHSARLIEDDGRSTCRFLERVGVAQVVDAFEPLVAIDVCGNAFLHNMVRIIVGSLVEVGCGRRTPQWLANALEARDRRAAGPTAPALGLVLVGVDYPADALVPWE